LLTVAFSTIFHHGEQSVQVTLQTHTRLERAKMIELMVQPAAFRDRSVSPEPLDLSVGPRRRSSSDVSRRHSDSAASDEFSDDSSSVANSQVGKRHKRKGCNPYKKSLMKRYCEFLIFFLLSC
jgi:hypothetical protein